MGQKETSGAWFKAGFWLPKRDTHRGLNEGLGKRERRSLQKENTRPYGKSWWAEDAVKNRAKRAQQGRKAVAKAQRDAKKKGWFS